MEDTLNTFEMLLLLQQRYCYVFTEQFLGDLRSELSRSLGKKRHLYRHVEQWIDAHYPEC